MAGSPPPLFFQIVLGDKFREDIGKGEPIEIVCRGMMGSNMLVRHHIEGAITDPARRYIVLGLHSVDSEREPKLFSLLLLLLFNYYYYYKKSGSIGGQKRISHHDEAHDTILSSHHHPASVIPPSAARLFLFILHLVPLVATYSPSEKKKIKYLQQTRVSTCTEFYFVFPPTLLLYLAERRRYVVVSHFVVCNHSE